MNLVSPDKRFYSHQFFREQGTGNREQAKGSLQLSVISYQLAVISSMVLITGHCSLVRQCGLGGFRRGATAEPVRVTVHWSLFTVSHLPTSPSPHLATSVVKMAVVEQ